MRKVPLFRRKQFYLELADALFDIMQSYRSLPYKISRRQGLYLLKAKTTLEYAQRATQLPQMAVHALGPDYFSADVPPPDPLRLLHSVDPLRTEFWRRQNCFLHIVAQHPDMASLYHEIELQYGVRTTMIKRNLGADIFDELARSIKLARAANQTVCILFLTDHSPTGTQIKEYFPKALSLYFTERFAPRYDYEIVHVAITKSQVVRHKLHTHVEQIPNSVRMRVSLANSMTVEEQWKALSRTSFYRGAPLFIFDWVKENGCHVCPLYAMDPQTLWDKLTTEILKRLDVVAARTAIQLEKDALQYVQSAYQERLHR